jgi:YggT family protein
MLLVGLFVYYALQAYILLIFVWVLGSWFPQWRGQAWYRVAEDIVRPYLRLFEPLPAQAGMIDFRPMVAILVLVILQVLVRGTLGGLH